MAVSEYPKSSRQVAFTLVTSLFFIWGFMTVMNDILVPHLKKTFALTYSTASLVQMCFFGAYFAGSLAYFILTIWKGDPIRKIGYKNGLVIGIMISATGSFLFYPAVDMMSYGIHLIALSVLGLGFTMLQISANPYAAILGPEETASSRLNLAQSFNSLGTALSPILAGWMIFGIFRGAEAVQYPYLIFAVVLVLLAFVFFKARLPQYKSEEAQEEDLNERKSWQFPHLRLGVLAIFAYVGAEVAIGSFAISFMGLKNIRGLDTDNAGNYLSLYWGGAMIGRFLGAVSQSNVRGIKKYLMMAGLAAASFLVLLAAINWKSGLGFSDISPLLIFVGINFIGFLVSKSLPARTLGLFAIVNIILLILIISLNGDVAFWSLIGVGLFNSIMWPNIFSLAIHGLGNEKSSGSSLLVMAIVGGAIVPLVQGLLADSLATAGNADAGLQSSFVVPLICYLVLVYYGFIGFKAGRRKRRTQVVLGIDIGGTNTKFALVSRSGRVAFESTLKTIESKSLPNLLEQIWEKITQNKSGYNIRAIGVGAPNGNYFLGCIVDAPNLPWKGRQELVSPLRVSSGLQVFAENDANAAAIGEKVYGKAKGVNDFVLVTIGTGLGSGFVIGGKILRGSSGFAGELGHVTLIPDGRECTCGRKGCVETYVSARGIMETASGISASLKGIEPSQLAEMAASGNDHAKEAFEITGKHLGLMLANVVAFCQPSRIFLGGGITKAGDLLLIPARKAFEENLLSIYKGKVDISLSKFSGSEVGVLGSAALAWSEIDETVI